jgi:hypothetical protein
VLLYQCKPPLGELLVLHSSAALLRCKILVLRHFGSISLWSQS